jgi:predicted restriction endonuclease
MNRVRFYHPEYPLFADLSIVKSSKKSNHIPIPQYTIQEAGVFNNIETYEIELEIKARSLEGDPEKIQLTKSRRGQGIFKANVRLVENRCRLTGVTNIRHLRASHIKPWSVSTKEEKLDGFNGLLLSPHVDHLFDRGFISFKNSGDLMVSKELNPIILEQWNIVDSTNVGSFKSNQGKYLEFHRDVVFKD